MKAAIIVFIISTILYVSAVIWIMEGVKLSPEIKGMICVLALVCIGFPTGATYDLTNKK